MTSSLHLTRLQRKVLLACHAFLALTLAAQSFATDFDYDGDGKADVAVRRVSTQFWYVKNSGDDNVNSDAQDGIQRIQFGKQATDIPVPADYDGDGITDFAVRRPSTFTWYIRNSSGSNFNSDIGDGIQREVFGQNEQDIPVPADYDGDGKADIAVRRSSTYTWYILNSSGSNFNSDNEDGIQRVVFGKNENDIPVKGDFNGDGYNDIAVRRTSNYTWYILNSDGSNYNSSNEDGIQRVVFGKDDNDIPVPADYDGDGITDIAVRRPAIFTWYILRSSDGELETIVFGKHEDDIPIPADYDGDGKADVAVRRPSNQHFYSLNSSDGEIQRINFGKQADDIPANAPIPQVIAMLDTVNTIAEPEITYTVPVSYAGEDQTVDVGTLVTLDGSGSTDSDGDPLTYDWVFITTPSGSEVILNDSASVAPTFTPDLAGEYVLGLTVNDGTENSTQDTVTITAEPLLVSVAADFHTPAPIVDILSHSRVVDWQLLSQGVADLTRFSFGVSTSSDVFILDDDNHEINPSLAISPGVIAAQSSTDEILLRSMFKFIINDDGTFRIVSTKHSNYVIDTADDSDNIILRDYRSGHRDGNTAAYLGFVISGTSPVTMTASSRWQYDATTDSFVQDSGWISKDLNYTDAQLQLTSGESSTFDLYAAPIDFDIPFDLNPDAIARVSNPEVTPFVKDADLTNTPMRINDAYAEQVAAEGNDNGTAEAALAMLESIETTLAAVGAGLRYPTAFYTTFREGLLTRVYESSDSTDGQTGQYTIPYVYFTNEADDDNVHHPFMVIASYNLPDSLTLLWDVPRPPGDGLGASYDDEAVTRSIHLETLLMKIPLRDYGEVDSLNENDMENDLATDVGETSYDHHNYASTSSTGVAIDGVLIYPSYNNRLHVSQSEAELSAHGMHSGRGLGAHYHADAFSAHAKGLNMYNLEDYEGHTHPPIISIGFDGVAGYGVYLAGDTSSDGVDLPLDEFGGHEHGDYGYHYHSFTDAEVTGSDVAYTAHQLPPLGAWAGRINDIPEFWDGTKPNTVGGMSKWLGNE